MVTHKEALESAIVEYEHWATHRHAIEACIKKYLEVRDLDLVPKSATPEMIKAGSKWSAIPPQTWEDMIDASPDPFGETT
jgi:hypothetical protein